MDNTYRPTNRRAHADDVLPEEENVSPEALEADLDLAQRCVNGDVDAWEEFYGLCHDKLMACIQSLLPNQEDDHSLVDEIAARVWYTLVENDGALLLKYDIKRGARLITFMRAIACDQIRRHYRSERRRQDRELIACRAKPRNHDSDLDHNSSMLDEFMDTLSARDREFCMAWLMNSPVSSESLNPSYTSANVWQKTRRMYKRLARFLGKET